MTANPVLDERETLENQQESTNNPVNTFDQAGRPPAQETAQNGHEPLFSGDESQNFRSRWQEIQGSFVDEPRPAVERANELVATVMNRLSDIFAKERSKMESEWTRGQDVSTEDLRVALRRYRSFFDRLLCV